MRIPVIAVALVLLTGVATAWAGSTINPTVPAQNSPLSSAPVRSNFLAAYNDVNGIEGMFAGSSAPLNPTQGQDWLNTTTITAAAWSKWSAQSGTWIELGVFNLVSGTFAPVFSTASFAATPPLAVTIPSGVVTYALNYGASLAVSGSPSSLVVNMANANAWSVLQTFNGGATVTGSFTATGLVTNADLANSTISGIALGSNLDTLTFGTHLAAGGTSYNGSAGVTITSDATNANTASTIVARDGSGNFSAGTITASLTGHASLDLALTGGMLSGLTSVDLGSGTGAPAADTGTGLAVYGADATTSRMETTAFGATATVSLRSSLGTRGSPSALTAGTLIASYNVHGYDGSIWTSTAYGAVHTYAQANWTSTSHETKICFATTPTTSSATNADSLCQYGDGSVSITTASATAFAVGLNGATNPTLNVDASTASQVAGLDVVGAVHNGTVAVKVIDSSGSTNLTINALGSGTIGIGNVSTGAVTITPATTIVGNLTVNVTGSGQCLQASSAGVVSGTGNPCGGSGSTPGGSNTQVQYNDSSVFGGISGVTSNGTSMTFANGDLLLAGSSSGVMTLEAPAAASTYVMTFPAATDTVAVLGTAQTFTAAKTFSNQISSTAALTVASASGATLDDVNVASETTTLTGTTTVTALSKSHFYRPTFTDSSAATLTTASTVTIDNSPNCTGSLTCTNQWALNVVAGATNFGGTLTANTGIFTTINGLTISTSTGTLSIGNGKTLTDTSGIGADLLLGATGGGFAAYGGASCTNQVLDALSAAGASTCVSITNSYLTAGTFANITGTGTLTAGATGSGFTVALGSSTITGQLAVANGGTGLATLTAHGVMLGEGTSNVAFAAIGTSGRLLIDQGAGADPSFNAMSGDATITNAGALTIANNAITYAKFNQVAASSLVGNSTGSLANAQGVTLGNAFSFIGTVLSSQQIIKNTSGTTYTALDGDRAKLLTFSNSSAIAVTLPQAGASSQFVANWWADFQATGSGTVTITPTTSTINGGATLALTAGQSAHCVSDGTNYSCELGAGSGAGSGTVTNATINTAGGLTNTGTCSISTAGTCTIYSPGGYLNKFRNGTFDVWQRGTGATSIGTSGNYFADGWKVYFTGSTGVTALQAAGPSAGYPLYSLEIEGATSNTDIKVGQRIESYVAAPLAGQTVTVQFWYYQNTGSTVTPKFSTCYASAQDNFGTCTGDVSSTGLTACATATWCQEALTFTASSSAANGYEIDLDCNAGFTSISVNCRFAAADIRVTPGVSTGVNTNPPPPELRPIATEMAFNQRYYQVSYYTTDPTNTSVAIDFVSSVFSGNSFFTLKFAVPMRAAPTFTLVNGSWQNETPVIETQVQQVLMGNASGYFYAQGTLGVISGQVSAEL